MRGIGTRSWRRGLGLLVMVGAVGGCAATIMENPTTKQRVNCTADATRLTESVTPWESAGKPWESTGKDVPRYDPVPAGVNRFEIERQCVEGLKRDGFVCVSGC